MAIIGNRFICSTYQRMSPLPLSDVNIVAVTGASLSSASLGVADATIRYATLRYADKLGDNLLPVI